MAVVDGGAFFGGERHGGAHALQVVLGFHVTYTLIGGKRRRHHNQLTNASPDRIRSRRLALSSVYDVAR